MNDDELSRRVRGGRAYMEALLPAQPTPSPLRLSDSYKGT